MSHMGSANNTLFPTHAHEEQMSGTTAAAACVNVCSLRSSVRGKEGEGGRQSL